MQDLKSKFIKDVVDVVVVSYEAKKNDGKITWWEKVQIGKEVTDITKYAEDMDTLLADLKNIKGEEGLNLLMNVKAHLYEKGIITDDVEELVVAIIEAAHANVKLAKVAVRFSKRKRS